MNILAIIPARYNSKRFPGKPLCLIQNKPMIQWVYERTKEHIENVIVATDHHKIKETVENFGGESILTSREHRTGTSRCYEAYQILKSDQAPVDAIINIQGDEPLVHSEHFNLIIKSLKNPRCEIATLATQFTSIHPPKITSHVFVVFDKENNALYFSRYPIPFVKEYEEKSTSQQIYYKHMGIYGFKTQTFEAIQNLKATSLEQAENLEQLRWLESQCKIKVQITTKESHSIDTQEDLDSIHKKLQTTH